MSIGEEEAAEVFKHLGATATQKLSQAMAGLSGVTREQLGLVLHQFREEMAQRPPTAAASEQYVRSVLTRALGAEKASPLIEHLLQSEQASGIESLRWMDAEAVAELVKAEHPQIVAAILSHLDADQASAVLEQFTEPVRNDVMLRIATLQGVQPAALRDLNEVLNELLAGEARPTKPLKGGVDAAAAILNRLDSAQEASATAHIRALEPDLAQKIEDRMFVFDDIAELDDRAVQLVLREIEAASLIVALKGTGERVRDKIFRNMSQRAAEMLRDDLDARGPVRLAEVETEQREILRIVRRLAEGGRIVLGTAGERSLVG
jgi:flagellar motor switch protein FliG